MNSRIRIIMILIAMLLLNACNPFKSSNSIPITNGGNSQSTATETLAAPTPGGTQTAAPPLESTQTQTSSPATPVASSTSEATAVGTTAVTPTAVVPTVSAPAASATVVPTSTATPPPSVTRVPAFLPSPVPASCNVATLAADVTIPDGTAVSEGQQFIKTWRLQNSGTCAWNTQYDLVFVGGTQMGAPAVVDLPSSVIPGAEIDLTVSLMAPNSPGIYQGNWMLRTSDGTLFGVGPDGKQPFWVSIDVTSPVAFAVTGATASVMTAQVSGNCQATIKFNANITTNGAGNVTYYWQRSDGSRSDPGALKFGAPGSQSVTDTWTPPVSATSLNVWDQVYIDQPNHQLFPAARFNLNCPSPTATH